MPTYNSTYPKVAVQCLNQALCLVDSEVLRNRHLQVAANRWQQAEKMKRTIIYITILILSYSCNNKSDCFGGRLIVNEVEEIERLEKGNDSFLVTIS
ncbi:MAG: hypothetical protein K1X55_13655 [Chitinophagales bacterium]|nr:hypothetical protein [Chitinophagales bacterium]